MAKRTRRRKEKEYPKEWPRVRLACGLELTMGKKALAKYDEAKGDERVIKCPLHKHYETWEAVDAQKG